TLNARDQPPAEVSDQRVSGLTGAVHSAPPVRAPHDPTPPAQPPTTQQPQPSMQLTRPRHGPNYGARSSAIQQHQNHTIRTALAPRNGPHDAHDGHLNYPRLCS
ncbi:hypothetical protein F9912_20355, partial [Mycobacterium tuberculosis]